MMFSRSIVRFCAWVLLLMFSGAMIQAQTTGTLNGRVSDAASGEPLPGANVMVSGTGKGASADLDGRYRINNVPIGEHELVISMIGYSSARYQQVRVLPDLTTTTDAALSLTALEGQEVVITAERPLIQKDATSKMISLSREEIASTPVQDFSGLLETQSNINVLTETPIAKSGYNIRGIDDVRLRGGRNNEVALLIDGVKVSNPLFGGFGTTISLSAIDQLTIASGGFNAKYGNALSGVINLKTSEGSDNWRGSLKYTTSQPFGIAALTNVKGRALNRQQVQTTLSGPLPLLEKGFVLGSLDASTGAGSVYLFDDIVWDDHRFLDLDGDGLTDTLPTSSAIIQGYLTDANLDSIQAGLGQNWSKVRGPDDREINPLDHFSDWQGFGWNNRLNYFLKFTLYPLANTKLNFSLLGDSRYRQFNNANAWYLYYMEGQNVQYLHSRKWSLTVNHTISKRMFLNLVLSRFDQWREVRVLADYDEAFGDGFLGYFRPADGYDKLPEQYYAASGDSALRDPFENSYYLRADNRWYDDEHSRNLEARLDLTWHPTDRLTLESGAQVNGLELDYTSYQNISAVDPFPTIYHREPLELAAYAQSKFEWEFIIINLGLRLDAADGNLSFWEDPLDPLGTQDFSDNDLEYNPEVESELKTKLSPRLGVALPLTANSILHFNFGHFYQNPNYRDLYRATGDNREISMIRGNIIGNPHLEHEKSVQYEIGMQQQIGSTMGLEATVWQKETSNQVGSVHVAAYQDEGGDNPYSFAVFLNNNSGFARGLDLSLTLRPTGMFSGAIHYSWTQSTVLQATSWDGYWSGATLESGPRQETRSPWEQPHSLRLQGTLRTRAKWGPGVRGIQPLQNLQVTLIQRLDSGYPYTPDVPGNEAVEVYSRRWPMIIRLDLKMLKRLTLGEQGVNITLEVNNLFDQLNVLSGYTRTGSATDPGTSSWYTLSSSYWDSRNNNNYGLRRTVLFGLEWTW